MSRHSPHNRPLVIIVDDEFKALQPLVREISTQDFSVQWLTDQEQALKIIKQNAPKSAVIVIDLKSSGLGAGGFIQKARAFLPSAAFLVTAPLGPFLYLKGEFFKLSGVGFKENINTILKEVCRSQGWSKKSRSLRSATLGPKLKGNLGPIIGSSPAINRIYQLIESVKDSLATILIYGESGTGKELVARTIHAISPRKNGPFVAVNCAAIPVHLIESELFGHERGAFTSAVNMRKGKFEVANGGTLFLDEIGEMSLDLQVKLLRVLQEKEFHRVGGNRIISTDARIIAATSRNLMEEVKKGLFREDLFFRLNVVPIHLPPLRERKEDVPILLNHFFKRAAQEAHKSEPSVTARAFEILRSYSYPGNVRELANIAERLVITCTNGLVRVDDLPEEVVKEYRQGDTHSFLFKDLPEGGITLKEVEKQLIIKTLEKARGNKKAAARMLGITRRLLYLRLAEYGITSNKKVLRAVTSN